MSDLRIAYLSVPPGGEKEKALVLGYSDWRSMMARMAAAPAPREWPTHTTSKSRVSCKMHSILAANSNVLQGDMTHAVVPWVLLT